MDLVGTCRGTSGYSAWKKWAQQIVRPCLLLSGVGFTSLCELLGINVFSGSPRRGAYRWCSVVVTVAARRADGMSANMQAGALALGIALRQKLSATEKGDYVGILSLCDAVVDDIIAA